MFVNAKHDAALRNFAERFGPVVGASYEEEGDTRFGEQLWSDLKTEHAVYRTAWELLSVRRRSPRPQRIRDLVKIIVDGISHWPEQHAREARLRARRKLGPPGWSFGRNDLEWLRVKLAELDILCGPRKGDRLTRFIQVPYSESAIAQLVLCRLVNAYPTEVRMFGNTVAELPVSDLLFGVRPALYAILRRELIGDCGVRFCKDQTCGRLFAVTHGRQEYCPDRKCEQRHRQRKYWLLHGSDKRRERKSGLRHRTRKFRRVRKENP